MFKTANSRSSGFVFTGARSNSSQSAAASFSLSIRESGEWGFGGAKDGEDKAGGVRGDGVRVLEGLCVKKAVGMEMVA